MSNLAYAKEQTLRPADARPQDRAERPVLNVPAGLTIAGVRYSGTIWDVSALGALVSLSGRASLDPGTYVTLTPSGYQAIPAEVRQSLNGGQLVRVALLHGPSEQADLAKWLAAQETPRRR